MVFVSYFVAACSSNSKASNAGRYSIQQDYGPSQALDFSSSPDATPQIETQIQGSTDYEVFGKRYRVLPSSWGFVETGLASWYGAKFHGHNTANGEVYDMYAMTAAHKHLRLPTYVRVTNLENNKVVIVRVNDRGPFHGDRVIDLSYAAASKLDFLKTGVARVKVEAINPYSWTSQEEYALRDSRGLTGDTQYDIHAPSESAAPNIRVIDDQPERWVSTQNTTAVSATTAPVIIDHIVEQLAVNESESLNQVTQAYYVQIGAFSNMQSAQKVSNNIKYDVKQESVLIKTLKNNQLHTVLIGPFQTNFDSQQVRKKVMNLGFADAFIIRL